MIKANINKNYFYVFRRYIDYIMRSDFHEVKVVGEWKCNEKSTLVIGNHISWWDGFFAIYLNQRFFKKKFYSMMLEEQLAVRKILTRMGAFSVSPGTRDVVESLRYVADLLDDKQSFVLMFPQGKIHSLYNSAFHFERGVEKIIAMKPDTQVLFYAAFVDYFSNRKPTLFLYLKEMSADERTGKKNLQEVYQAFYDDCFNQQSRLTS